MRMKRSPAFSAGVPGSADGHNRYHRHDNLVKRIHWTKRAGRLMVLHQDETYRIALLSAHLLLDGNNNRIYNLSTISWHPVSYALWDWGGYNLTNTWQK